MDIPYGLVEYSPGQLERMADEVFPRRPHIQRSAPINMERLIQSEPDVDLQIRDNLSVRHKVEGCVCKEPKTKLLTVFVDTTIFRGPWADYNAVLGEEFAHMILHPPLFLKVETIEDFLALQGHPEWGRVERDAKRFGRCIRMPLDLLDREAQSIYTRVVDEHGFVDAVQVEHLVRHQLSQKFRSPPDDVRRRMLDYPTKLTNRIHISVLSQSDTLAPVDFTVNTEKPVQRRLWLRLEE